MNCTGQTDLRKISELEEPPEAPENQWMLKYIKKLATYMSDLRAKFLGFARDAEVLALVLVKELDMIFIWTEVAHKSLGQDKEMDL